MNLEEWLLVLEQRHPQAIELGLERCGAVYRRMGSPRPAKQVITVAGTNGKGSTVAYVAAMCAALGLRYGTYTSPHIFRFNERISIMGEPVTDECLVHAFEQVEVAREEVSLTYFEFSTLAGFLILQQSRLDCAVLEVGLGGRLDTVNLVDTDCAIITPIGLDHQNFLGPDLYSIASEKAGIIRAGVPVVCTESNPPMPIIDTAERLQAPLYRRGIDFGLEHQPDPDDGLSEFSLAGQSMRVSGPSLPGKHQWTNLASALAALAVLNPDCFVNAAELSVAIQACRVPGRLQKVFSSPEILLDVGHNALAARAVATYLKGRGRAATVCVLAMLADKPAEEVARELGEVCSYWLCADSGGERGQSGRILAYRVASALPGADVDYSGSLDEAMQTAVSSVEEDGTILVFGSFLTVSAAANWLQNRMRHDGHDAGKIT